MPSAVIGGIAFVAKLAAAKGVAALASAAAFKAFAVGAAFGFASNTLMREFAKKPSQPLSADASANVAGSTRGLTGSVIPKRWILGRARVSGGLMWLEDRDNYSYEVRVLSEGSIDGIERVWAHGEEVEMTRNGNVLTPVSNSKYWGIREVSYEEEYFVDEPSDGGGGDGPSGGSFRPSPPSQPRDPSSCFEGGDSVPSGCMAAASGGCRSSQGSAASRGDPSSCFISDGSWSGEISTYHPGALDMSPWAIARYNEAVSGTQSTAGAMASAGSAGGEQGEGGGETFEERQQRLERERAAARSGTSRVRRTRTRTREERVPLIKITEFFKADGTEGAEIRAIASSSNNELGLPWTEEHKCNGFSYVLIELYQPDYGDDIDERFWPGRPDINFLVRGIKTQWPVADSTAPNGRRLTEPAWTRNAACLRYWYLTERRNIDPLLIDLDAFTAACRICDEDLQLTEQSGYQSQYPESVKRYTIDGSITSGDSAASIDAQFDFAWQGFVIESSGNLVFRPGTDLPSKFTITEDDIIAEPVVKPFGRRSDLSNEVTLNIEQSSGNDFLPENFKVVDSTAQESDGERLPQELSRMLFVTEPVQAVNILHQRLRQQRGLIALELHVKSPPDWRYLRLIAGDKITVRLPEFGIGIEGSRLRDFRVTNVLVNDNYTANLSLLEWPEGLFDDRFDFPPRAQKFSFPIVTPPAPVGTGRIDWNVDQSSGDVVWTAFLSWDSTPYETIISVDSPATNTESKTTRENFVNFDLTQAGRYTFNLRHRTNDGLQSSQSQVVLEASAVGIKMPRPVILEATQNANIITFQVENVPNRDITGLDIRYQQRTLDTSFADIPVITAENWQEAPQMFVSPVVPPNELNPIFAQAVLPVSGSYKIYVRFVNKVGNLSDELSLPIDARFEIPATSTGSQTSQPQWAGTHKNTIKWEHDSENRVYSDRATALSNVTSEQWNGEESFPFGRHSTNTSYTTLAYDFTADGGKATNREIYVVIETSTPTDLFPTGEFEIELLYKQGSADATIQDTIIADGGAVTINNIAWVQAKVSFNDQSNQVLTAVTIGWREVA